MGNIWSSPATARMTSWCAPPARGVLSFEITGYSQHRALGAGTFIQSAAMDVGGYRWCIRCYPNGDSRKESKGYVGVYLELLSKKAEVRALYELWLVDQEKGGRCSSLIYSARAPTLFSTRDAAAGGPKVCWGAGWNKLMEWNALEASSSPYLKDDRLVIECHVTVIREPWVVESSSSSSAAAAVEAPRRSLSQDFSKLLETKIGADVTFKVQGQAFAAHTCVLAARSPVFRAQFSGEHGAQQRSVTIQAEDMEPAVFEALLRFVYTDSVSPSMAGLGADEKTEMWERLLVAAVRYDVEGLKLVCERALSEGLDADTVASVLVLAARLNCDVLRDACVEYIAGTCRHRLRDVVASDGYGHLKASYPAVFVDLFEKVARIR
ncbi:hypothetical protein PVAP13_6KG199200 [Panicum virgatum]|uniref:Uncharacterized protein n=2 Tax=Panicum virgatum TaxID=38727 RepID=A0A8T0R9Q1_PANVG|nr:hypothetical protein PVAP13_6KG199200 [Panicum virgatum]